MNTFNPRIAWLWQQFTEHKSSPAEMDELMKLLATNKHDEQSSQYLQQLLAETPAVEEDRERWTPILQSILKPTAHQQTTHHQTPHQQTPPPATSTQNPPSPIRRLVRRSMTAAAILLLLAGIIKLWHPLPAENPPAPLTIADIKPGGSKATLLLANGDKIILDSAATGTLAIQGNSSIQKLTDGRLTYNKQNHPDPQNNTAPLYNTLTTPRGGQYQLTLPDGTQVWLNAASSITYPPAFTGNSREVTMTGEAYFEVAHDDKHPFRVRTHGQLIQDIGTRFNVNSYTDEPAEITTLLEGAVKVNDSLLHPGQQASLTPAKMTIGNGNSTQAVAWKNGLFDFSGASLEDVMRQLSRWYDMDVRYEGPAPKRQFTGMIGRTLTLAQVLHGLAGEQVHYHIEKDNHLIITP